MKNILVYFLRTFNLILLPVYCHSLETLSFTETFWLEYEPSPPSIPWVYNIMECAEKFTNYFYLLGFYS